MKRNTMKGRIIALHNIRSMALLAELDKGEK
jgi:hypothetical protein